MEDTTYIIKPDDVRENAFVNGPEPQERRISAFVILKFNHAIQEEANNEIYDSIWYL